MIWEGLAQTAQASRPIALFIEEPGGPLDQAAHDADVATFLNDRFHAVFLTPAYSGQARGMWFVSPQGCLLLGPVLPVDATAWSQAANAAVEVTGAGAGWSGVAGVAAPHPLSGACPVP